MPSRHFSKTYLFLALFGSVLLSPNAQADQINWRSNFDAAKVEASRTGKFILLHFYTPSCGPCKRLENEVFTQPQIGVAMEQNYVPVKVNADASPALANAYQINRVPSEVVLTPQGNVLQKLSCPLEPNAYGAQLVNVAQHYRQHASNQTVPRQAPANSAYAGLKIGAPTPQPKATVTGAKPAHTAEIKPVVKQNPYFNKTPAASQTPASPVTQAQQQVAAQRPTLPANAMPNSFRRNVAENTAPTIDSTAPTTPQVQQASANVAPVAAAAPVIAAGATPNKTEAWPPQLPAGTPPLGFDGYCPVSLKQSKKWVRGDKAFGAIHRGRLYLFTSLEMHQQFLTNPDAYSPVFSGNDPVKLLEENQQVAGSRKFGFSYRGAFYLFSSKETMEQFAQNPDQYSKSVRVAMDQMDAAAGGTLRR